MPIHYDIELFKIQDEINKLKKAGMTVTHIIPVLIQNNPNSMFISVIRYAIIFEEPKLKEEEEL